jgi:hypothetical protein
MQKIWARCSIKCNVTYFCEHTDQKDMCSECYQSIHWIDTFEMVKKETSKEIDEF